MNTREKVRAHLVREARARARETSSGLRERPLDMSRRIERAERDVSEWHVDHAIANALKKAELCEFIVRRFGHEFPDDLVKEIGERGRWHREVYEEVRKSQEVQP